MEDRVYFKHGDGLLADFFIKGIKPMNNEVTPNCRYAKKFLKDHPEYVHVGKINDTQACDWRAIFEGYKEVECPEVGF